MSQANRNSHSARASDRIPSDHCDARLWLGQRGAYPVGVKSYAGGYVSNFKVYAVGLVDGHFGSLERTAEIFADQNGVKPSDESIQKWIGQLAGQLKGKSVGIGQTITAAEVAHFDEAGLRDNGRTHLLHVVGTAEQLFNTIHPRRGQEAMTAAGILPRFTGCEVQDNW